VARGGVAQLGRQRILGALGQRRRLDAQRAGQVVDQLAADSAPVVLDQVEVGRRNPDPAGEVGLADAGGDAAFADARAGEALLDQRNSPCFSGTFCTREKTLLQPYLNICSFVYKKIVTQEGFVAQFSVSPQ